MKLRKLFHLKKSRKYPIKRDREGLSLRARCFELFDQGKRPAEVAEELNMKLPTVFRYFRDWKRIGPDFSKQYAFVKELFKKNSPDRDKNIEVFSRALGIPKEQFEAILSRPHGLKRFMIGKSYFPVSAEADHKRSVVLLLAILISDHLIKDGGKFSDVYHAFRRLMKENRKYREQEDADIVENNEVMRLVRAIIAADIEKEWRERVKPDRLSGEERNTIMKWEIDAEKKSAEKSYWIRIGVLKAGGLTEEQAREKIYQDLIDKGDIKMAKMMREFQDKVHPVKPGNNMSPPSPS